MATEQKPLEILVVDDEEGIRVFFKKFIELTGEEADTSVDGQEGIDKYVTGYEAGHPYDAVLTDLSMQKVSGADVTKRIKELSPTTPVYVITARESTEEYKRLEAELGELKPDGVLQKPILLKEIKSLIEKIRLQVYGTVQSNYQQPTQS